MKSWIFTHRKAVAAVIAVYCALLTSAVMLGAFAMPSASGQSKAQHIHLTTGWTVLEDGQVVAEDATLPYTPQNKNYKELELRRTLPEVPYSSTTLITTVYQKNFQVLVGEKTLYAYTFQPRGRERHTPGSGRFFVQLPEQFQGEVLRLLYGRMVPSDHTTITTVSLYNEAANSTLFLPGNRLLFFLMLAILLIGAGLLLLAILLDGRRLLQSPLFYLSLFALSTSIWVLCSTQLMQLFTNNLVLIHDLEYLSFYVLPLTLWLFVWTNWHYSPRITLPLIAVMCAFLVLSLTLKFLGLVDFFVLLPVFHLLVLGNLALFFFSLLTTPFTGDFSLRIFVLGFGMLAVCSLVDMVRYYFFSDDETIFTVFIFGVLLLMLCTLASYLSALKGRIQQQAESRMYKALAYTDRLTGLHNRLTFDEDLATLEATQDRYTSIILVSLDVNNFKHINDAYGHIRGDEVLHLIGERLTSLCTDGRRCYRMGGDEFYLIALNSTVRSINGLMEQLNAELYHAVLEFPLSISFGVAEYNRFLHSSLSEVLKEADDIMYRHKKSLRRRASDRDADRRG